MRKVRKALSTAFTNQNLSARCGCGIGVRGIMQRTLEEKTKTFETMPIRRAAMTLVIPTVISQLWNVSAQSSL